MKDAIGYLRVSTREQGRSVHACQVLRPRQATEALAMTLLRVLPSANRTASAPSTMTFRGSMAGLHVPLPTLRLHPRGCRCTARGRCGSLFLTSPWTFTTYSSPVLSRRTLFLHQSYLGAITVNAVAPTVFRSPLTAWMIAGDEKAKTVASPSAILPIGMTEVFASINETAKTFWNR